MIKKLPVLVLVFLLLILDGCSVLPGEPGTSAGRIIPPSNKADPFSGEWEVSAELDEKQDRELTQLRTGSSIQFTEGAVALDDIVYDNVSYKIKRVNSADYLATKYVEHCDLFGEDLQMVEVTTIYASGNYLGEFLKLDDERMIFFVQYAVLLLKKVSDDWDYIPTDPSLQPKDQGGEGRASGILLGLRISGKTGYTYSTIWVAADRGEMSPVLTADNLFFPRKSGFWELSVQDIIFEEASGNILTARNLNAKTVEKYEKANDMEFVGKDEQRSSLSYKIIDYVGNDYIAVEKNTGEMSRLQVLPVDKLSSEAVIKISVLLDETGMDTFINAYKETAKALSKDSKARFLAGEYPDENFGLSRKDGHWIFKGRINYQSDGMPEYTDYELKIAPPSNLIFYDSLVLSWYKIRDRVPDAVDAFTSPNKDIALVKTKNKLLVFRISPGQLVGDPIKEIRLKEGTDIIMAEWATGSYVENWRNTFISYGAKALIN